MKFDERNKKKIKIPTFLFPLQLQQILFFSSNFMKLCKNIHCSVWQLLGVEQIQNGCHCHGNGQNAKNSKNTVCPTDSDFLAYLVPLDVVVTGNITAKICEIWREFRKNLHLGYHGNGRHFEFCKNIHCSVWQLLGLNKFKMAAIAMVTKVQKMLNSLQISQIFAVMFPVTRQETLLQRFVKFGVNLKKIASWLPWQRPPF
jgi:hypothetical protein